MAERSEVRVRVSKEGVGYGEKATRRSTNVYEAKHWVYESAWRQLLEQERPADACYKPYDEQCVHFPVQPEAIGGQRGAQRHGWWWGGRLRMDFVGHTGAPV